MYLSNNLDFEPSLFRIIDNPWQDIKNLKIPINDHIIIWATNSIITGPIIIRHSKISICSGFYGMEDLLGIAHINGMTAILFKYWKNYKEPKKYALIQ